MYIILHLKNNLVFFSYQKIKTEFYPTFLSIFLPPSLLPFSPTILFFSFFPLPHFLFPSSLTVPFFYLVFTTSLSE